MSYVMSALWALVYYLVVSPISFVLRRFSPDPLDLDDDPTSASYWQTRSTGRFRPMTTQR